MPHFAIGAKNQNLRVTFIICPRNACALAVLVLFVFSSLGRIFALDPRQALSQLYHTSWTAKEGVSGYVIALAQTTDGYLWVGTTNGLLRFDGISFEQFRPEMGSLPGTMVSNLMAVPDGGLWVGFYQGGASFEIGRAHV